MSKIPSDTPPSDPTDVTEPGSRVEYLEGGFFNFCGFAPNLIEGGEPIVILFSVSGPTINQRFWVSKGQYLRLFRRVERG